jgi:hypothetical protein
MLSVFSILEMGDETKVFGNRSSNRHSCNPKFFPVLIDWNSNWLPFLPEFLFNILFRLLFHPLLFF